MDGVNTYNCQCPPEWTGKGFVCASVYLCVLSPLIYSEFVHSGLLSCYVQNVVFLIVKVQFKGFRRVCLSNMPIMDYKIYKHAFFTV